MDNKKFNSLRITHLILLVAAFIACMYSLVLNLVNSSATYEGLMIYVVGLINLLPILALLFGAIYFIEGYKKNAASFYKIFMFLFIVEFLVQVLGYIITKSFEPARLILTAISLIAIIALFAVKNLGKNKSIIIVAAFIICRILMLIIYPSAPWNENSIAELIRGITDMLLALSALFMVAGKYVDKTQRGTK